MVDRTKKLIYWIVYAVFVIVALVISLFKIIPINNTAVFLFGLIWVWNGASVIIKIHTMLRNTRGSISMLLLE